MRRIRNGGRVQARSVISSQTRRTHTTEKPAQSKLKTIRSHGKRVKKRVAKWYEHEITSKVDQFKSDYRRQRRYRGISAKQDKQSFAVPLLPGIVLICIGILLFLFPDVYKTFTIKRGSKLQVSKNQLTQTPSLNGSPTPYEPNPIKIDTGLFSQQETKQPPLRIVIPRLSLDIPIVEAPVVGGTWELSDTTASHGVGSANPGENGNIVVFAHAREKLFLPIRDMKAGDFVYILTKDRWFRYQTQSTTLVDPTDIETIAPTKSELLTLFTCSGFDDNKRMIVTATPLLP